MISFYISIFNILYECFWAIFEVEPFQIKFYTMLLISLITLCGVETTLQTYINGATARLFKMVVFPFVDNLFWVDY